MADYTVTINIPDHKLGDKWPGIATIGPVLVDGVTPSGVMARVRMNLKHELGSRYFLDSEATANPNAPITRNNEVTWLASIAPVQDFLPLAGDWTWDMAFWEGSDTSPLTFYKGVLTVEPDI